MAPFPEVELVTIDRLEVALRKMDFKLLKDGTYKLHEKYHSGHKFEYLDKLKEILMNVVNNNSIPEDIKDILCPTINDILLEGGVSADTSSSPYESLNQNRVSSLTQLSYNTKDSGMSSGSVSTVEEDISENKEEAKISAFDVFGADKSSLNYSESPFKQEENKPFQEFIMPESTVSSHFEQPKYVTEEIKEPDSTTLNIQTEAYPEEEIQNELPKDIKNIALFYCQDVSIEKTKNILRYRELISSLEDEHHSINEILNLISEINIQSNTNIIELKNILDQLHLSNNTVNLITNSSSADLIGLMEQGEYSYSLYYKQEDKKINLIPVYGLSNQFICSHCREEYLDTEDKINPLVLQCPTCKNPMFPNFYTANNENIQMNLDYYNSALMSLAESKVWVVIHPVLEDKIMMSLILNAIKLSSKVEEIYILDKDINVREDFRNKFMSLKEDISVNIQMNALEEFLNTVR